jgi:hypothetical protein
LTGDEGTWVDFQIECAKSDMTDDVSEWHAALALLHRFPEALRHIRSGVGVPSQPDLSGFEPRNRSPEGGGLAIRE